VNEWTMEKKTSITPSSQNANVRKWVRTKSNIVYTLMIDSPTAQCCGTCTTFWKGPSRTLVDHMFLPVDRPVNPKKCKCHRDHDQLRRQLPLHVPLSIRSSDDDVCHFTRGRWSVTVTGTGRCSSIMNPTLTF